MDYVTNGCHPAFPTTQDYWEEGISKREYLAGLAMQALLSNPSVNTEDIAELSVKQADALLTKLDEICPNF